MKVRQTAKPLRSQEDILRPNASPEEKDRALAEAVAKMFAGFPPRRA
jgi:hypothetical protein